MSQEIKTLIVGAIISLVSTIIGLFSQTILQAILKNKGKVKIYYKKVYSKFDSSSWGFRKEGVFSVPLWIEFHNTKEKREIIRNLNLQLFLKGKKITNMTQISGCEQADGKEVKYGNNGAYSFILEPTSISKYDLHFMIKKEDVEGNFDEVKLSYYDSKGKHHQLDFIKIDKPWKISKELIDRDWIYLK